MTNQFRWARHDSRMPYTRIPKQVFYGHHSAGDRSHCGQPKRYKDHLKPGPRQQKFRSNIVEATGDFVAGCFDIVAVVDGA